ncbi:hypothetical protein N9H39_06440 [Gammaproteobacteria bacterium]|nr:hypothetical protein [Gammaproteobacteria bacterium]
MTPPQCGVFCAFFYAGCPGNTKPSGNKRTVIVRLIAPGTLSTWVLRVTTTIIPRGRRQHDRVDYGLNPLYILVFEC